MALTILIIALIFNIFVSVFVLVRNPRNHLNQSVCLLAASFILWQVANYFADKTSPLTLFWNRATFIGPIGIFVTVDLFLIYLQHAELPGRVYRRFIIPASLLLAAFCLSPYVISGVTPRMQHGQIIGYDVVRGWGYMVIIAWFVVLLARFIMRLVRSYYTARGVLKKQVKTVAAGILLATALGCCTNIVAPLLTGNTVLARLAPLTSIIVMSALTIAIVRQGLFNIRFFIVRSVAYIAALAVLAGIYGTVVFGLAKLAFNLHINIWAQVYISVATALAALGFSNLKALFDRISNKLFYHDAYDGQELLDRLNRLFVANTELDPLLKESADILESELKAEFCFFGIKGTQESSQRIIGHSPRAIDGADITKVQQITPRLHQKLIVADDLPDSGKPLHALLEKYHISILGRLAPTTHQTVEGIGYLVLGPRRSGNPYTRNDLRVIEIIVNELVIAIENSLRFEEIQNFNETLQANVSDATRKLRRTNDKLQALDATKDEFISMASHQLRTPLTSVKGYLSMVLEGDAGKLNAQQKQLLTQSYASAQRMVYLISDLLNLSRLSTGKFVIESVPTDLSEVVQSEIEQLQETAKSRDVTLTYERPATFPSLMLDETKIHQVVMNFMDNAIYYTPPGGHITVALRETDSAVEFTVRDNGIGVPRAEQHRLFSKFYRAGNARKARPDGTGLGLFMAKKVIAAQGGSVVFDSEEGKGSTFGFRFSKAKHAVPITSPTGQPAELAKV